MKKTEAHRSYAKINLALSITGFENGLHTLDSLVTNIDVFDTVTAAKRTDNEITVAYSGLREKIQNDSAKRMAELLQKEYNTAGVDIFIKKRIPMSAGLGGSSADAAGVAHCMRKLFGLGSIPQKLLLECGSDVPYMYEGGNKRMTGKGEKLESIELPKAYCAVVVCPGGVNTAEAYALYDKIGGKNADIDRILRHMSEGKPFVLSNALQKAAEQLNRNIPDGLAMLSRSGFENTVMSGSGSSVVGITFDKKKFHVYCGALKKLLPQGYILL